jgi:dTDP-6-deoxy-L-talose 4-dehydrogenase [NAD(P)+]
VKRALLLGATGFVGRHVVPAFEAAGWTVLQVARTAPEPEPPGFAAMDLSQEPPGRIAALIDAQRPDVVINGIGSIWGATDADMPTRCTEPTLRLLAGLRSATHRPRLVHLGSVLEYGPTPPGANVGAASGPPATVYGATKLAATEAVLAADAAGEADAIVLRIANAAGPGTPRVSLLGRVAEQLSAVDATEVRLTRLTGHRDYVDVRDVADAVLAAARSGVTGAVLDIGRGEAVPVRSLVELLISASGVPARLVVADEAAPESTVDWIRVDIAPAAAALGWRPRRSLADAIGAYWEEEKIRAAAAARL